MNSRAKTIARCRQVVVGASVALVLCLAGCKSRTESKAPQAQAGKGAASERPSESGVAEVEDQLRSALFQLQPENLNIDARLDDATSVLNNWWAAAKANKLLPQTTAVAEIPANRVAPEVLERLKQEVFDARDGSYVRDCYLAKRIAQQVSGGINTEPEQIQAVVEWVCRNIALWSAGDTTFPEGVYHTLILGRGTAQNRAFVAASILRQLQIDCAVLAPISGDKKQGPWWFAAISGDQAYLYDLELGLPVPGEAGVAPQGWSPAATLLQVREHPEWLSALTIRTDRPYAWTSIDLGKLDVRAIAMTNGWSPRMWVLEQLLPGEVQCVLYGSPSTTEQSSGLFERIAAAVPGTEPESIQLWEHSSAQEVAFDALNAASQRAFAAALSPLICPVEFEMDKASGQTKRVETLRQLRTRTEQLFGERSTAVSQYITIRQLSIEAAPEAQLIPIYQRAADDAFFWSAVCKLEAGERESAISLLNDYLRRYRRNGQWVYHARLILGETYASLERWKEAIQAVQIQESDDPYREHHALRLKQWQPLAEAKR